MKKLAILILILINNLLSGITIDTSGKGWCINGFGLILIAVVLIFALWSAPLFLAHGATTGSAMAGGALMNGLWKFLLKPLLRK